MVNSKRMANAAVRTEAGTPVGRLVSLEIDADTGKLAAVNVRTPAAVPHLLGRELRIGWNQIVSLGEKEIVVLDAVVPAGNVALSAIPQQLSS